MLENAHLSEGVAVAKQRVTIADVAREAGTSTASVSYYLNDKREKLSEKTQNKIARVIKELGYVPNAQAQTLTGKQTHVIAIIILDNTNKWAGLVLNGMEQVMLNEDTGDGELFPALWHEEEVPSGIPADSEITYDESGLPLNPDGSSVFTDDDVPVYADKENTTLKTSQDDIWPASSLPESPSGVVKYSRLMMSCTHFWVFQGSPA